MTERSKEIFGNPVGEKAYRKAVRSKQNFIRKFGDDSAVSYPVHLRKNPVIGDLLGVYDVRVGGDGSAVHTGADTDPAGGKGTLELSGGEGIAESADAAGTPDPAGAAADLARTGADCEDVRGQGNEAGFDLQKGIIVGNIRMGFGHYRISMAIASAAHALGYTPYWMDLNSYPDTSCTKVISAQNDLYSMGSRLSQKSRLFNALFWEPLNYEGFRKLSYNASDQKNAEIMAAVFKNIPKEIPLVGTHVWPAQAALHGGMRYVVNAIPDNWPMGLHLAEGSVHTIQTQHAYQGYRILNGMKGKEVLRPMPTESLVCTGHYIDDELVRNIEEDCAARVRRKREGEPMRFLLTIGGAGAQREIFAAVIRHLLPAVKKGRAVLYINVGDYRNVWDELTATVAGLRKASEEHFNNWEETREFAEHMLQEETEGIHAFWHENIFEAVYCTNLLLRSCDVLITKPSELAFYPVPKLFIRRIGGHEQWGAIHSAEIGDGTLECRDIPHVLQMLDMFLYDEHYLEMMCGNIISNKKAGIYDGAYEAVRLAMKLKAASE